MILTFVKRVCEDHFWGALLLMPLVIFVSIVNQATTPPATPKAGTIKGRVVNEHGQPLPNAKISITTLSSFRQGQSTTTDREGNFEFTGLEPVTYHVIASLSAYAPVLSDEDDARPPYYRVGDFVTFVLVKGGAITGTITTQTGEPVVGVLVRAKMISGGGRQPFPYGRFVPERMTDDRGIYRIYGLPTGTYIVWAGGAGGMYSGVD